MVIEVVAEVDIAITSIRFKLVIKLYVEAVNKEGRIRKFNRRRSSTFRAPTLVLIG